VTHPLFFLFSIDKKGNIPTNTRGKKIQQGNMPSNYMKKSQSSSSGFNVGHARMGSFKAKNPEA
jgi:hypothetical protein